jgi:hypothetical protein
MTFHLTAKNSFSMVAGGCVLGLTLIPMLVGANDLVSKEWRGIIIAVGTLAIVAIASQTLIQSSEDDRREQRDHTRDKNVASLMEMVKQLNGTTPEMVTPQALENVGISAVAEKGETSTIEGELYRLVLSPRTISWPLVRDLYRVQGHPEDAKVDCDVLIEMYLVNTSSKEKYIRDMQLSCEINGVRTSLTMQHNLRAMDSGGNKYEYALEDDPDLYAKEKPLRRLFDGIPSLLSPEQPTDGWARFLAPEINPDQINSKSWQLVVVDSVGNQYPITKVSDTKRSGEIGIRRLPG